MEDIYAVLAKCNIDYEKFEHQAVFTCEESEGMEIKIPGAHTKQLLTRDKKGRRNILAIVMHDKTVDMKELGEILGTKKLSFASPDRLKRLLGVDPGSVTPFGLMFDAEKEVEVIFDKDAWEIDQFRFHPLINTATLVINRDGFQKFLAETGHEFKIMKIPSKS
ncbi:prolyl-tRNA synthetase associated domain-containing protein [Candidatus Peribacteria bacterium]|jgi:Ala-tRNA(Pro) deacylase|nr:prolyl-tRNA synthetase associated domain-containing protein [Candidatus Peribacteria bacterium]MBT4020844.1 prolyl-tRNA synthetase associated domain-containing protein [Candidatus Peribacteria bacterium]MBT4241133.1 prolyl-tRNA synthetase associated domain-containing protein [Candidatus Peribacteria bacterium]MBT4473855.1 prolyl-tRNA synthetase associated domain-containing protein [Candidatus Peribacteria bacterium]